MVRFSTNSVEDGRVVLMPEERMCRVREVLDRGEQVCYE